MKSIFSKGTNIGDTWDYISKKLYSTTLNTKKYFVWTLYNHTEARKGGLECKCKGK